MQNLENIIRAFGALSNEHNAHLNIIGDGSNIKNLKDGKYILRDNDGEEKVVYLNSTRFNPNDDTYELKFKIKDNLRSVYLKKMSYGNFLSFDKLNWKKSANYIEHKSIVHIFNQMIQSCCCWNCTGHGRVRNNKF